MIIHKYLKCIAVAIFAVSFSACDPWEEHDALNDTSLDASVMEILKKQPDLTTFVSILEKTGYDTILVRSQAYTVFAPSNEAWNEVDTSNIQLMRSYIKNHITFQSITEVDGVFNTGRIRMLNGKLLSLSGNAIEGKTVKQANLLSGHGVIHIISSLLEPKMNIWEFINQPEYADYSQVKFFNSGKDSIIDLANSYLLYLDDRGRPVYDTAWIETNEWLSRYPINNEDSTYSFLLIDVNTFNSLKEKYKPYFSVFTTIYDTESSSMVSTLLPDSTDKHVVEEISRDMILKPVTITGEQVVMSVDGVKVNIPANAIDLAYKASNGMVYVLSDVKVKMYQNKVKEIIVEGENYSYSNVASTIISKRYKDWASGNFDVVLSGRNSAVVNGRDTSFFGLSSQSTAFYTNVLNSYLAYTPTLNSVPYKVYWRSYDDLTNHVSNAVNVPQKLFFSNPGAPVLTWSSGGVINNNFLDTVVFVGQNTAGNFAETQLEMWSTTGTTTRIAKERLTTLIDYEVQQLPCYSFGKATLWVSNNVFSTSTTTGGSLFLDYIRLVPVVKPDE
jgi:uncharacterized surface protein with fasciclin (FAS1) repeats